MTWEARAGHAARKFLAKWQHALAPGCRPEMQVELAAVVLVEMRAAVAMSEEAARRESQEGDGGMDSGG